MLLAGVNLTRRPAAIRQFILPPRKVLCPRLKIFQSQLLRMIDGFLASAGCEDEDSQGIWVYAITGILTVVSAGAE